MFSHSLGASSVPCSCPPVASLDLCTKILMLLDATRLQPPPPAAASQHPALLLPLGLAHPAVSESALSCPCKCCILCLELSPYCSCVPNYTFFILGGSQSKPLFLKAGCSGASFQCESLSFLLSLACTCLSFLQSAPVCICTLSNGSVG